MYKACVSPLRARLQYRALAGLAAHNSVWLAPYNDEMQNIIDDVVDGKPVFSLDCLDLSRRSINGRRNSRFLASQVRHSMSAVSIGYRDVTRLGVEFSRIFEDVTYCEQGFIANRFANSIKPFISYVVDKQAPYFDGRRRTDLEDGLNNLQLGWWMQDSSTCAFLHEFKASEVQKYEAGSLGHTVTGPRDLVIIGQCAGDQSLVFTAGETKDNADLVKRAVFEYGSDFERIFFRPHPKNEALQKENEKIRREFGSDVVLLGTDEPFSHLLKGRPTVATMSSGGGLEAAIKGCPVISYCVSFYSNWGFTVDKCACDRRTAKLSAEDVFLYIYTRYSRFLNPFGPGRISALEALRGECGQS